MFASFDPRSFWPQHLIECLHKCIRPRRPFDGAVHAERQPVRPRAARGAVRAVLLVASGRIGDLADERMTSKWPDGNGKSRSALPSVQLIGVPSFETSGNSQHPGVQVQTRDLPGLTFVAAKRATTSVPQATSSTSSPVRSCARRTRSSAHFKVIAGTR